MASGSGVRHATPSRKVLMWRCADDLARVEREGGGGRAVGHYADDLGVEAEQVTASDQAADATTHAHRHVHHVQLGYRGEQLQRVSGHAEDQVRVEWRHHLQVALGRQLLRVLASGLVVVSTLDHSCAEPAHRRILVRVVARWHHDRHRHAGRATRVSQALAMVSGRRGDDAARLTALAAPMEVGEAAPHLERTGRRVVLVLDPHLRAELLGEQGPGVLRRRWHMRAHDVYRGMQVGEFEDHALEYRRKPKSARRPTRRVLDRARLGRWWASTRPTSSTCDCCGSWTQRRASACSSCPGGSGWPGVPSRPAWTGWCAVA